MAAPGGVLGVAKKKRSESRKHTAMMRVDDNALMLARKAASLMEMSLADWASDRLREAAKRDIAREIKKLSGGSDQ